jgi:V/A-type H+-transporting ATPase subunit A
VRCFWALDRSLAYARHFPAIHWLSSYSEYVEDMADWYNENVGPEFLDRRAAILKILYEESDLLEIARVIRLGFAQQNAYHDFDTYVPFNKQLLMMEVILYLHEKCLSLLNLGLSMNRLLEDEIFEQVIAIKYNVGNDDMKGLERYKGRIDDFYNHVHQEQI